MHDLISRQPHMHHLCVLVTQVSLDIFPRLVSGKKLLISLCATFVLRLLLLLIKRKENARKFKKMHEKQTQICLSNKEVEVGVGSRTADKGAPCCVH